MFQFFNLVATMSVEENLRLPLELVGRGGAEARARVSELLDQVGGVTEGQALARLTLAEAWHAAGKAEARSRWATPVAAR